MNKTEVVPERHRFEYLDGLRGLAATIVVTYHFTLAFLNGGIGSGTPLLQVVLNSPLAIFLNGEFCVYVFFVLSGFVLSHSSDRSKSSLVIQITTRYLRLTVPMLASLLLGWAAIHFFPSSRLRLFTETGSIWLNKTSYGDWTPSLLEPIKAGLYAVYLKGWSLLNSSVWTMKTELRGSLLIFVLYRFAPTSWRLVILSIASPVVAIFWSTATGFLLGAILREMWIRKWLWKGRHVLPWLALAGAFLIAAPPLPILKPLLNFWEALGIYQIYVGVINTGATLLVYAVLMEPLLRDFLVRAVPQFLGRISFSIYLVHVPLILSVGAWSFLQVPLSRNLRVLVAFIVVWAGTILLGWAMTRWLDEPLVRGLRHLKGFRIKWPGESKPEVPEQT